MPEAPAGTPPHEARTEGDPADALLRRAAGLLGEQSADIADQLDRWCDTLSGRLQRLQLLAATAGPPRTEPPHAPPGPPPLRLPPRRSPSPVTPALREVRAWPVATTWQGWESWDGGDLLPGGIVRAGAELRRSGAVTRPHRLESGGLYRVSVERPAHADAAARLHCLDGAGAPVAADRPLPPGTSEHVIFVSHRLRTVRLAIAPARIDAVAEITSVALAAVDIDSFQQSRAHLSPAPIVALVTARPHGPDDAAGLRDAVESLLLQCDAVRVTLDSDDDVPGFLRRPRVTWRVRPDGDALPDESAFGWHEEADSQRFLVLAAGAAPLPPDFCTAALACLARHGYRAVAGLRGFLLQQPILPGRMPTMLPQGEMRLAEVSPAEIGPAGVSPPAVGPAGVSPAEMGAGVSPADTAPAGFSPVAVSPVAVSPVAVSPVAVSPAGARMPDSAASAGERTVHLLRRGATMLHGACLDLRTPLLAEPMLADAALAVAAQNARVPMLSVQIAQRSPQWSGGTPDAGWDGAAEGDPPRRPRCWCGRSRSRCSHPAGRKSGC
jgi:hypothetical protein